MDVKHNRMCVSVNTKFMESRPLLNMALHRTLVNNAMLSVDCVSLK